MKKIFISIVTAAVLLLLTGCAKIQSKDEFYSTEQIESDKSVLMSVNCSEILENMDSLDSGLEEYIPEYGLVVEDKAYPIKDGDTVYDLLIRVAKENKIQIESKGFFGNREIEGINYIYNSSCGKGSRWIYKVNGEIQQPVCSDYKLKDGDIVQWIYVCNDKRSD
ncbi:MAG: DUF4430 domain-containing protein [Oscillospiraceae bacterium]|nr:DUF4430 domain-containing protein [Oscillospiraceae bacterium]